MPLSQALWPLGRRMGRVVQKKPKLILRTSGCFFWPHPKTRFPFLNSGLINPTPYPARLFMILVAIFSLIVLLLCFLCYSGDCNN